MDKFSVFFFLLLALFYGHYIHRVYFGVPLFGTFQYYFDLPIKNGRGKALGPSWSKDVFKIWSWEL